MRVSLVALSSTVILVAILGCGSSGNAPVNPPSTINNDARTQSDLVERWERFVSSAKSRESDATNNYIKRRKGRSGTVKVKWGIADVVKSDSISAPYLGKVDLTVYLTDEFSTGKFQYSLQFVPSGTTWKYRGGKKQRFDRSGTDDAPLDYPELEDEVRVLFTGGS